MAVSFGRPSYLQAMPSGISEALVAPLGNGYNVAWFECPSLRPLSARRRSGNGAAFLLAASDACQLLLAAEGQVCRSGKKLSVPPPLKSHRANLIKS